MKVRIIGAGFSGLAMAYALIKKGIEVDIYESSSRLGGLLGTEKLPWGVVESAANAILATKPVLAMADDIGVELLPMRRDQRKRYIFRGRPRQLPLSALEITRMTAGLFRRPVPMTGQDLRSYAEATFGHGAANYLIEPMMFGIFSAPLEKLSARLIYNYFFKYKSQKSTNLRGSLSPKEGMGQMVKALAHFIEKSGGKIHLNNSVGLSSDRPTVIATNAHQASEILIKKDEWVSSQLAKVKYLPLTSVTIGYKEKNRNLRGFGCLFPSHEDFNSLGVLFNNDIFENRGPYDTETWMLRGTEHSDKGMLNLVLKDRERIAGVGKSPDEVKITRWPKALPAYSVELEKVLEELVLPQKVYLAGNYLGRMGLSKILDQCIDTADRIVKNES